jgi:S-adenosylmethionine:tRNA ribosyltransferase-isomerase
MTALAFAAPRHPEPPPVRDAVRLLAATPERLHHARFHDLPELLRPGDLLVVNTSATLPAALPAANGLWIHLSTPLPPRASNGWWWPADWPSRADVRSVEAARRLDAGSRRPDQWPADGYERWVVELREGTARFSGGEAGERLALPGGAQAELLARYRGSERLWAARLRLPEPLETYLARHGRPIRYGHTTAERPLADYQTIFATDPGSAEMPSAGRPFTDRLVTRLLARGIAFASITLHAGVSSLESGEPPYPERFRVPPATAAAVNGTQRVIAVGTTVVRALETVARPDGAIEPGEGWTNLVIGPGRGVRAVDGIITGWHEPDASHLQILEAVAGSALVERSYAVAAAHGYRWHEFGDSHLLLP